MKTIAAMASHCDFLNPILICPTNFQYPNSKTQKILLCIIFIQILKFKESNYTENFPARLVFNTNLGKFPNPNLKFETSLKFLSWKRLKHKTRIDHNFFKKKTMPSHRSKYREA
jgi:hypothetical protein